MDLHRVIWTLTRWTPWRCDRVSRSSLSPSGAHRLFRLRWEAKNKRVAPTSSPGPRAGPDVHDACGSACACALWLCPSPLRRVARGAGQQCVRPRETYAQHSALQSSRPPYAVARSPSGGLCMVCCSYFLGSFLALRRPPFFVSRGAVGCTRIYATPQSTLHHNDRSQIRSPRTLV